MKINKEDIKQEVFDLYDDYAHNRLTRRDFMEKLSLYAAGSLTVPALMSFLMPDYKNTLQVAADDPRLKSEYINYKSEKG
ncbi:MAG TPA: dienelactone hydrolase family protein, partial [Puia sp.]